MITRLAWPARIAWTTMLGVLALLAVLAQLDRTARFAPAISASIPAPMRGFAQQRLTEGAIIAGDAERSMALARHLVRIRPAPAEHLSLLARAELLSGNQDAALAALQEAGMRGWRDPVSQRAMAEAALASGSYEVAAQRIAALLATGAFERQEVEPMVVRLAQSSGGRSALAQAMAAGGYWQRNFVGPAASYLPPEHFAELIALAQQYGAALSCDHLQAAAQRFERRGNGALVEQFWPATCPVD